MEIFKTIKKQINSFFNRQTVINEPVIPSQPLRPFMAYNSGHYLKKDLQKNIVHEIVLENEYPDHAIDRLINISSFDPLYSKLISKDNFFTEDKLAVLENIFNDAKYINDLLAPLETLHMSYGLGIVGGSVRDFVLNKHNQIKDLDIVVYLFPAEQNLTKERLEFLLKEQFISEKFSAEEMASVQFSDAVDPIHKVNKIIEMCMNRGNDLKSVLYLSPEERVLKAADPEERYGINIMNVMSGLIKTNGTKTHYPIDLIVTENTIHEFMNKNDFNICKVGFGLIYKKNTFYDEVPFPIHPKELLNRFYSDLEFWKDVHYNTVTFNPHEKVMEQIIYSFDKRGEKLMKKYPEYEFRIANNVSELKNESHIALQTLILRQALPIHEASNKRRQKI